MHLTRQPILAAAILFFATIGHALAQSGNLAIDPTLAAQIAAIPAIDNHAHPMLSHQPTPPTATSTPSPSTPWSHTPTPPA